MKYILITMFLLAGCATTQPLQVTATCPRPVLPDEPAYPVQDLTAGDGYDTVAKSYLATAMMQRDYIKQIKYVCQE